MEIWSFYMTNGDKFSVNLHWPEENVYLSWVEGMKRMVIFRPDFKTRRKNIYLYCDRLHKEYAKLAIEKINQAEKDGKFNEVHLYTPFKDKFLMNRPDDVFEDVGDGMTLHWLDPSKSRKANPPLQPDC